MATTQPVKRSEQLAPLSRDHHDGLLFGWKIKQGLKNGTKPEQIISYVRWFWDNHLQPHFNQEEQLLLPQLQATDEMAEQMKDEHQRMREIIAGTLTASSLEQLANELTAHIRFEERKLFPHIEQQLSPEQLNEVHRQLEHQPHCMEKWEHEFWLTK